MAKTLNLRLSRRKTKPVFELIINNQIVRCMLDTGADMPVWCGSSRTFHRAFPDAQLDKHCYEHGGFGKGSERVQVYEINNFKIYDEYDYILFRSMFLAVSFDRRFGCDLIISATVFGKTNYSILNITKERYPILRVESPKDVLTARVQIVQNEVRKLYSFSDI